MPGAVPEISVQELKRKLDAHDNLVLLDVREPNEYKTARIDGAKLIPLGEFPARLDPGLVRYDSMLLGSLSRA